MNRHDPPRYGVRDSRDQERARGGHACDPYEAHRTLPVGADDQAQAAMRGWDLTHPAERARARARPDPFRGGTYPPHHVVSPWLEPAARHNGGYRDYPPGFPSRPNSSPWTPRAGYGGRGDGEHVERFGQAQRRDDYGRHEAPGVRERLREQAGDLDPRDLGRSAQAAHGHRDAAARGNPADSWPRTRDRRHGPRRRLEEGDGTGRARSYRGIGPRGYVRSDERLREMVCERLTEADLDASHIEVQARDGVVTLEGSVRDRWSRHRAEDIADDCGAKDIRNQLRVGRRNMAGGYAGLIGHSHAGAASTSPGPAAAVAPTDNAGTPDGVDGPLANDTPGNAGTCGSEAVNRKH